MKPWLPFVWVMLAGISLTAAYSPFDLWLITPVALIIVIRQLLMLPSPKKSFMLGWVFGLGWFGAGISWVHVSIADFGGLPLVASLFMMFLLCGYLALFPAITFFCAKRFFSNRQMAVALPILWFVFEWVRSWFLTGFPWLSLGYSQLDGLLSGWLPVIGETGVSIVVILLATVVATATLNKKYISALVVIFTLLTTGIGLEKVTWVTPEKDVAIGMAQGNIAQSLRWLPEQDIPTMDTYRSLTDLLWNNDLIIWPEAAIPKLELLSQEYLSVLDTLSAKHDTALVTGIVNYNYGEAWNNLIVLGKQRHDDTAGHYSYFHNNRYGKHHLLPIGEFVPFEDWLRKLAPIFDLPMSSFSRGDYQQSNLLANGFKLAPAICFEIAFPRQVLANIYADTDFIITVSNDAWFGHSHGPAQHLQIARMRAKELGIPVIRSTNNGISGYIDFNGQVVAQLPQFEVATLSAQLSTTKGTTPYRYWGDSPLYLMVLLSVLRFSVNYWKKKHSPVNS